jgi:hypothetical protein
LVSEKTLANYASEGQGPPFWNPNGGARGGRARYHALLCDKWLMGDRDLLGLQTTPVDLEAIGFTGMATSLDPEVDPFWEDGGLGWDLLAERLEGHTAG